MTCIFCDRLMNNGEVVFENTLALAYNDKNPVSKGHMIFITKRHAETFFDINKEEREAIFQLVEMAKEKLDREYKPDGYNIGLNCGISAGQSVMHIHLHLIPRYNGDVENPRGGVRGVIPHKRDY